MSTQEISNRDDIIDSRDIIARISELEKTDEIETVIAELEQEGETISELEDDARELVALRSLQDEAEGYCPDWHHGATLIRDSYFKDYAEELAGDIGAIDPRASWPLTCIDWEEAADELKQDYTSVEFDGVTYWVC